MAVFQTLPRVIRLEALGAVVILVLMALNEFLDLPRVVFGEEPTPLRHHEFFLESAGVLVITLAAMALSWLSLRRRHELEELLVMCSWCRKVRMDDRWLPLEVYLKEKESVTATRGLCPACYAKQPPRAGV